MRLFIKRAVAAFGILAGVPSPALAQAPAESRPRIQGPLSVDRAVEIALRENPMIGAAQADVRAAQAERRAMQSMTRPQISANTYLSTGNAANILSSSPNVTPLSSMLVPTKPFADQNLTLMFPLYTGGRLGNLVRAASEKTKAATADVGTSQIETALMVRDAYYRALAMAEMVKVAEARVEAGTELIRTQQALADAGKAIEANVQRAQAELADAQKELVSTRNEQAKAVLDLMTAMGVNLESEVTLSDSLAMVPVQGDLAESLAEANRKRPELLAVRARIQANRAQVSAAKGSLQPQVYGTAMGDAFASSSMSSGTGGTLGVVVSVPLFDSGQRRAETAQSKAMLERMELEGRSLELKVSNEVRQSWLDLRTAAQNVHTAETALLSAQSAYDVTVIRVQNQKAIVIEQLDMLAALSRAKANLAQALFDHSIAAARLRRVTGRT